MNPLDVIRSYMVKKNMKAPIPDSQVLNSPKKMNNAKMAATVNNLVNVATNKYKPEAKPTDVTQLIVQTAKKNGIHPAVMLGQWAAEGRGQHKYAKMNNNPFNINAIDENPDAAYSYPDLESGINAYASLIKKRYAPALSKKDAASQIRLISELGYAGSPSDYGQRAQNGYDDYASFVMDTPEFKQYSNY